MTARTRYFVVAAAAALIVGLGGGLVAYLTYTRGSSVPAGLPPEVRFVPANAEVVGFADMRALMRSELRRELMPTIEGGSRKGRQMMSEFAGIDVEKQVNRLVGYVEPFKAPDPQAQDKPEMPRAVLLVQGTFDAARIEQFIRDRAGAPEDHKGRKIFVHRDGDKAFAVGLVSPDLVALGQEDLVRRAIDTSLDAAAAGNNITTNREVMNVMRDASGGTAWVVAHFDALQRQMRLPAEIGQQVPPLRLVSARADVNGGIRATVRAEAGDEAAAAQLRDVVRGFISLARLHAGGKSDVESALKSIELSGTDKTVRLSFSVSPEALRTIAPRHRRPDARPEP